MQPEPQVEIVDPMELELVESQPATLFRTSDPEIALERMSRIAGKLVEVVDDRKLYVKISGKKYLFVSAWTTLGGMLGVFPVVIWTRPNESGDGILARVEARTRAGEVIGAAEAECSRAEPRWETSAPYAIRSMASTRAISRALRGPLEQVVVLAGYEATAAEEMPADQDEQPRSSSPVEGAEPSPEQLEEIRTLVRTLARIDRETDWPARCREIAGVPGHLLTRGGARLPRRALVRLRTGDAATEAGGHQVVSRLGRGGGQGQDERCAVDQVAQACPGGAAGVLNRCHRPAA